MNPAVDSAVAAAPPPLLQQQQLLQPNRPSTSCDRHPQEHFTGFCPLCLCERLAVLDPNSSSSSSSSRKPPTSSAAAAAALKAIFRPSSGGGGGGGNASGRGNRPPTSSSSFLPELRRTKSFSASKNEGFSGVFEPQRRSCDVRARSTLWSLFNQDDGRNPPKNEAPRAEVEVETRNLASSSNYQGPAFVSKVEEEDEDEHGDEEENVKDHEDEIMVVEEPNVGNVTENRVQEIVEEEVEPELVVEEDIKTMKDHIDLDSQTKKTSGRDFKEIAGSFWSAASVFSKKLQKWRQNQKMKKRRHGGGSARLPVEKPIGRQFRDTQSEIADYGFGRRSCDTDPRFSLDAGRMSFDDPRYSLDEPRASWDGYLIGRTFPRMPTMLSVVEDDPVPVLRTDTHILTEEPANAINENDMAPGGSALTKEYYSDSRRRKSLDRSNSIRKTAAAVVAEMDELKPVSNAKVTPASADYLHGQKTVFADRDLRDSNSNSMRDDSSETFDMGFRDTSSVIGSGDRKGSKKSGRWSKAWSIWSFFRGGNKDEDEDRYSRANGVERSYSESWPDLRGNRNVDARSTFNAKVFRSNSSVSWRNAQNIGGSFDGPLRKNGVQANGQGKKAKDEFALERNRSARYSPSHFDNGLLRFYLTPLRGSRRNGFVKSRSNQAHSIARSVLRLY
ncbi:protein OCTOPUS-like isoform X2 [Neltuma alba]|uniref:protein OCTOPUS-like isoform X2 n=1 Tax=Neltuma alba TaxID=207710 RepID=UPI0010A44B51|nr:protein OCTOPUS-like isoform X2 [Prosopis alba]XP_028770500.1 protein OCTOPUS-like isoform X2 [Prosopis alba]XP_028770501.1 protein OCTOPUS-like isoform X2 [Prosopis alba]XP_028770502.1 protein OCTOPUS-like isoform X2 [Prosopis alba]